MRLFELARSLPGALLVGLLTAGALFHFLDSGRRLLTARRGPTSGLLILLAVWLVATLAALIWALAYPSAVLFGDVPGSAA